MGSFNDGPRLTASYSTCDADTYTVKTLQDVTATSFATKMARQGVLDIHPELALSQTERKDLQ